MKRINEAVNGLASTENACTFVGNVPHYIDSSTVYWTLFYQWKLLQLFSQYNIGHGKNTEWGGGVEERVVSCPIELNKSWMTKNQNQQPTKWKMCEWTLYGFVLYVYKIDSMELECWKIRMKRMVWWKRMWEKGKEKTGAMELNVGIDKVRDRRRGWIAGIWGREDEYENAQVQCYGCFDRPLLRD